MRARADSKPCWDDLDQHIAAAGSIARAVVPMGFYLTWCANLKLLSAEFEERAERLLLRTRFREARPSELLVAAAGGSLDWHLLNDEGVRFTDGYYAKYLADFAAEYGEDVYAVPDDWDHYDRIARVLARHYFAPSRTESRNEGNRGRWWQFWK